MLDVPPKCIINIPKFLEQTNSYDQLVVEGGLLDDHQERKKFERRIVLVFVVHTHTHKIYRSTKDSGKTTRVPQR